MAKPTKDQIENELPDLEIIKSIFGEFFITRYWSPITGLWRSHSDPDFVREEDGKTTNKPAE